MSIQSFYLSLHFHHTPHRPFPQVIEYPKYVIPLTRALSGFTVENNTNTLYYAINKMSNIGELNGNSFGWVETFDLGFTTFKRTRYHSKRISITNLWSHRSGEAKTLHQKPFLRVFFNSRVKRKKCLIYRCTKCQTFNI